MRAGERETARREGRRSGPRVNKLNCKGTAGSYRAWGGTTRLRNRQIMNPGAALKLEGLFSPFLTLGALFVHSSLPQRGGPQDPRASYHHGIFFP